MRNAPRYHIPFLNSNARRVYSLAARFGLFVVLAFSFIRPRQGVKVIDITRLEAGLPATFFSRSCPSPATIVTAYYNLKTHSKHSEAHFKKWNARFFSLSDNMVIFSDWDSSKRIIALRRNSRGCTLLVRQKLSDTEMFDLTDWDYQHRIDPEKTNHHVELYIIWDQKPLWLEAVAKRNPFQSTHFFWADSGQFRDDAFLRAHISKGEKWVTSTDFIPPCKSLFISIENFKPHELQKDRSEMAQPLNPEVVRLGGGNFGGDSCSVLKFAQRFRSEIRRYLKKGLFVGKDQPIYGSICTSWRDMCFLVDAAKVINIRDKWFAAQPVLHGVAQVLAVPEYTLPS